MMNSIILVTVLMYALAVLSPSQADRCKCESDDGTKIDLTPLQSALSVFGQGYFYIYSPCGNLTLANCQGAVICQNGAVPIPLGYPNDTLFSCSHNNYSLKYTAGDRTSIVGLVCNNITTIFTFQDFSSSTNTYSFLLSTPYVCSNVVTSTTQTAVSGSSVTISTATNTPLSVASSTANNNVSATATNSPSLVTNTTIVGYSTSTNQSTSTESAVSLKISLELLVGALAVSRAFYR